MTYIFILKFAFGSFLASGILLFFYGLKEAISYHEFGYLFLSFIAFIGCGTIGAMLEFHIMC